MFHVVNKLLRDKLLRLIISYFLHSSTKAFDIFSVSFELFFSVDQTTTITEFSESPLTLSINIESRVDASIDTWKEHIGFIALFARTVSVTTNTSVKILKGSAQCEHDSTNVLYLNRLHVLIFFLHSSRFLTFGRLPGNDVSRSQYGGNILQVWNLTLLEMISWLVARGGP